MRTRASLSFTLAVKLVYSRCRPINPYVLRDPSENHRITTSSVVTPCEGREWQRLFSVAGKGRSAIARSSHWWRPSFAWCRRKPGGGNAGPVPAAAFLMGSRELDYRNGNTRLLRTGGNRVAIGRETSGGEGTFCRTVPDLLWCRTDARKQSVRCRDECPRVDHHPQTQPLLSIVPDFDSDSCRWRCEYLPEF